MKQLKSDIVLNVQQARQHIKRLKKQVQLMDVVMGANANTNANINNNPPLTTTITTNEKSTTINYDNNNEFNLNQYMNSALYSLVKNDQQITTKVHQYKANNKLPSIYQRQLSNNNNEENHLQGDQQQKSQYYLNGYRKYRNNKSIHNNNNKNTIKQQQSSNNRSTITKKSLTKSNKANSFSTKACGDESSSFAIENRKMKIHSFQQKNKPIEVLISSQTKLGSMLQYDNLGIPLQILINKQFNNNNNQQQQRNNQGSSQSSIRNRKYQQNNKIKLINFNLQQSSSYYLNGNNNILATTDRQREQQSQKHILAKTKNNKQQQQSQLLKYESVVDNFSNHYFMVINGRTATQSPQFASYTRIYKSIFNKIQQQIKQLQKLLKTFNIPYARFDGKKLAYLCLKQNIKRQQLIQCLVQGREELLSLIPQTKYKGKQGRIKAVNKIIAYWKMSIIRKKFLLLKQKTIHLQKFFRRQHLRLQLQSNIIKRNTAMSQRFQQRQLQFQQQYKSLTQKKRIQIHINSIECDEQKRLTIQNFNQRQNIQLSRIFRLKDEDVIIVYVSSKEIPHEVVNYYYKILQLSDVKNFKDRLFFLSPLQNKMLHQHLSTTKLLYYCSSTLKQLKNITQGTPSIIYSGSPSNQLIKIADFLNCYLFSGQPSKMKQFLSKSQTKRLLKNLCIETLPGSMQMYDYGEFLNTFSVLIVKNPQISTWVLKIDDEFEGRGIAYIQLGKSKLISSLLKKGTFLPQNIVDYQQTSEVFATDIVSQPTNQQITIKIRDYLKEKLPNKLVIVTQTLYRNYQQYMGRFIKKGGIIEAHPPCSREFLTYPSVSFCLQPDGEAKILSTYQKFFSHPFKSIACEFPQKSLQYQQILSLCRQLTQSFKIRKLFGYFTVDLISYRKNQQSKFWVLGIQPYINNYASSFYLFDALMQGKYLPQKGTYLTEVYADETTQKKDNSTIRSSVSSAMSQQKSLKKSIISSSQSHSRLSTRTYIFIPHFLNKNFCKINIKSFFKQARIEEFNFDIAQKHGICMLLFDQLTSGQLGLMAVSETKDQGIEKLKKVLEFIARITNIKTVNVYGKTQLQASTDAIQVHDVISKFLTMQRKQKRKDAKKKAIQRHKNKQDLDLII